MRWLALGFCESNTQPIRVLSLLYKIYTKKGRSLSSFQTNFKPCGSNDFFERFQLFIIYSILMVV